jgi:hypothetical protein
MASTLEELMAADHSSVAKFKKNALSESLAKTRGFERGC